MNEHLRAEQARVAKARASAIANGHVLLTVAAAAYLYDLPRPTIVQAVRRHEDEAVAFIVDYHITPVPLLRHEWAEAYWKRGLVDRFQEMSEFGYTIGIHGTLYVIFHPRPIYTDLARTRIDPDLDAPDLVNEKLDG